MWNSCVNISIVGPIRLVSTRFAQSSQYNSATTVWFQKESKTCNFRIHRKKLIMAAVIASATGSSSSSSSSSSAARPPKMYHVFISFRGEDTRSTFTSHLHAELRRKEIQTYIDYNLDKGDEIGPSLLEAIEESYIAVVIFSENYAYSKWCLDELIKIMECKEKGQIVVPVFHKIDPSVVRHQTGNYSKAFAKYEKKYKINKEKIQKWKGALKEAANLCGWDSMKYETESEFVEEIVKNILQKLNRIYPSVSKRLVGIEHNYACIESMLKIESEDVRIIGIWGMGGIGKTTLAEDAFTKLSSKFKSRCFLENVREEATNHGLNNLRNKLFSELLKDDGLHISTPSVGTPFLMRMLSRKRVLIVLDDVNTSEQLEYLIGGADCLGLGSRVIITTRDKQVLSGEVHDIHQVKELDFQSSLKLFCMKAFKKDDPKLGYEKLSKRAVNYAQGVPLALKILGSFLHSQSIEIWESALEELKYYPNESIQNVLRLSYNGLDDRKKEIFLDIAFFFKGVRKEDVIRILDACGFYATVGIECLLNKALITITSENVIKMHDLIQEMGKEIVRQESTKSPGRRSRLCDPKEIYDILKNNKMTEAVEGIILNMSQIKSDVPLSSDAFKETIKLRILKFFFELGDERRYNVLHLTALDFLPESIRYLFWEGYPLKSLPTSFCPVNLVELSMKRSKVEKLWDGIQDFVYLNKIDFSFSRLKELPDFSKASNLENVILDGCASLREVHPSILSLKKLRVLNLIYCCAHCYNLKCSEITVGSTCLSTLHLSGCRSLKKISIMSKEIMVLWFYETGVVELSLPVGSLDKLDSLSISECLPLKNLSNKLTSLKRLNLIDAEQVDSSSLEILFNGLSSLAYLFLVNCCNLYQLPDNINLLSHLSYLDLSESNVETLPASIIQLSKLRYLSLEKCKRLQLVPEFPPSLGELRCANCASLETLPFTNSSPALASASNEGKLSIYLENCMKLNGNCVNSMLKRMKEGAIDRIVYPGSKVPNWFSHQITETAITIEPQSPSSSNLLCGSAVFCVVLSTDSSIECVYDIRCKCTGGDGEVCFQEKYFYVAVGFERTAFGILDHVFVWYDDFPFLDQSKVLFEFFVEPEKKREEVAISIKGCGVHPIYDTKNEHVIASSSAIPPVQKPIFPTLSTATNWKNQSKGLIDILSS